MSDRLALTNAMEDAGIERAKAERVASVIVDMIRDNVATKADVVGLTADIASLGTALRGEIRQVETRLQGRIDLVEHRLLTRLGSLAVVLTGLLFAALRFWPPHG